MEEETIVTKSVWQRGKLVTNILVSIVAIGVTGYIGYIGFRSYHYLFSWHVFFGALAYLLLMTESLMIFDDVWFTRISRRHKSWIHGGIVGVATIFAFISVYLDFHRKEIYKAKYDMVHFESPHAITGLISVIILIFASASGFVTANISWFRKNIATVRPVVLKLSHNVIGQLGYLMGVISIIIIFYTPWFMYHNTMTVIVTLTLLIILATLWSLINSYISGYTQVRMLRS